MGLEFELLSSLARGGPIQAKIPSSSYGRRISESGAAKKSTKSYALPDSEFASSKHPNHTPPPMTKSRMRQMWF